MKSFPSACVLVGSLAFGGVLQAAPQHAHADHAAHSAGATATTAAPVQRWAADADLRKGMQQVHEALADLRHHEMGHMPASVAIERAGNVEDAVNDIFTHCKLAPDADAALHRILVPLLSAANRLENDSSDVAAVAAMRDAVAAYPQHFDDPLWSAATSSGHEGH